MVKKYPNEHFKDKAYEKALAGHIAIQKKGFLRSKYLVNVHIKNNSATATAQKKAI